MATYHEILSYVVRKHGKWVHTCWIAHVKEHGLSPRRAPNRFPGKHRANPCPLWARPLIEDAFKHFRLV